MWTFDKYEQWVWRRSKHCYWLYGMNSCRPSQWRQWISGEPPEMDLAETREAGCDAVDVPTFPVLFIEIVKCERAVECVLPRELGREEEVKLAEDGDMRIDEDVVVDLRTGVWDFTLEVVCLALDPVLVLAREVTLASDALVIKVFFRGGGGV